MCPHTSISNLHYLDVVQGVLMLFLIVGRLDLMKFLIKLSQLASQGTFSAQRH